MKIFRAIRFGGSVYDAVVYHSTIDGEDCHILLISDSRLSISNDSRSERIQSFDERMSEQLCSTVEQLICGQNDSRSSEKFDRCCRRLARVRKLIRFEFGKYPTDRQSGFSPKLLIEAFCDLCESSLPAYGCRLTLKPPTIRPDSFSKIDRSSATSYFCSLLFNALSLSSNRAVEIGCGYSGEASVAVELSTETDLSGLTDLTAETESGSADELALTMIKRGYPFGLDLLVSSSFANESGWRISYSIADRKLTLRTEIPVESGEFSALTNLRMPLFQSVTELISAYLADLS